MILYILLFVWGMQSQALSWKHFTAIPLLAAGSTALGLLVFNRAPGIEMGPLLFAFAWAAEFALQAVAFAIGFGVGKYRRRGQASHDDVTDTFS